MSKCTASISVGQGVVSCLPSSHRGIPTVDELPESQGWHLVMPCCVPSLWHIEMGGGSQGQTNLHNRKAPKQRHWLAVGARPHFWSKHWSHSDRAACHWNKRNHARQTVTEGRLHIHEFPWISITWTSMNFHEYSWCCMNVNEYSWIIFMKIHKYSWIVMNNIHEHPWIFMYIHDFTWICMNIHE